MSLARVSTLLLALPALASAASLARVPALSASRSVAPAAAMAAGPAASLALPASQLEIRREGPLEAAPVVLVHGIDASRRSFNPVIPGLAEDYRVIAYSQRGHGGSPAAADYSLESMAADLGALFDQEGLRDAHLVGHSAGARTALALAARNPERVRSLTLEDMHVSPLPGTGTLEDARRRAAALKDFPQRWTQFEPLVAALRPHFGVMARPWAETRSWRRADGSYQLIARPEVSQLYGWHARGADLRPALAGLDAPALLLRGLGPGGHVSDEALAEMKRAKPDLKVAGFPAAGHRIHGEDKDGWLSAVKRFLAGVELGRR